MLPTADEHSDLFERIDRWKQEVLKEHQDRERPRAQRLQAYESSHMKLRSRPTRPALVQVSENPSVRKHKASATMADAITKKGKQAKVDEDAQRKPPRRGRPPKSEKPPTAQEFDMPIRPASVPDLGSIAFPEPSSPSNSPSEAATSPSRKQQVTFDTLISDAAIDMDYLRVCDPAVKQTSFADLRLQREKISSSVWELHEKLWDTPNGFIPSALRNGYTQDANTPRRSKEPNLPAWYLDAAKTPFSSHCLDRMKNTVDAVLEKANRTNLQNAHEHQWGHVVCQLLCEVELWQKSPREIIILNVESCSVQPGEIRPKKPDGAALIGGGTTSGKSSAKSTTASEDIGRMVDWCLGMNINEDNMNSIRQAYRNAADMERSLNQSQSYIRNNPLILDIVIKKTLQLRDPKVQLAIWAASALLKKRHHKWDTSMPMPAIAVNGHAWQYYIFFEMDKNLIMAGPYEFGTTANVNGIWSILYRLHVIMKWGMTEYKDWFEEQVMKYAREGSLGETSS